MPPNVHMMLPQRPTFDLVSSRTTFWTLGFLTCTSIDCIQGPPKSYVGMTR